MQDVSRKMIVIHLSYLNIYLDLLNAPSGHHSKECHVHINREAIIHNS